MLPARARSSSSFAVIVMSGTFLLLASVSTPAARSLRRCASRAMRSSAPPKRSSAMITSTLPVFSSEMRIFFTMPSVSNCCVVVLMTGFSSSPAGFVGSRSSTPEVTIDCTTWSASMLQSWMFMRSGFTIRSLPFGSTYCVFWQAVAANEAATRESMAMVRMVWSCVRA